MPTQNTKKYTDMVERAVRVLRDADAPGWRLARVTHDAVCYLQQTRDLTKADALALWARDVARPKFSKTSARRYFDVWEKYGDPANRECGGGDGEELSFAEHYAIVRGGAPARAAMNRARAEGRGVHNALAHMPREQQPLQK